MQDERELDALVDRHIFGVDPSRYHCPHFDEKGRMLAFCNCPDLPRRVNDYAGAMQVVLEMTGGKGYAFRLDVDYGRSVAEARFWSPAPGMNASPFEGKGPMSWAICAAALRAVGVEGVADHP